MEQEYFEIFNPNRGEVDLQLLEQHTRFVDISNIREIQFDRVQHLNYIGKRPWDTKQIPPKGVYISQDDSWLMASNLEKEHNIEILAACEHNLRSLLIYEAEFSDIDVSSMSHLQLLNFTQYLENPYCVKGIEHCSEMTDITLVGTMPESELNVSVLGKLRRLYIMPFFPKGKEVNLVTGFQQLSHLEILCLVGVWDQATLDVSGLPLLEWLYLWDAPNLHHIFGLEKLSNLELFCVKHTGLRKLPEEIRLLDKLRLLGIIDQVLDELPDWLPELGLEFYNKHQIPGIVLEDTTVKDVDMSIFEQPQEMILQWFTERKKGNDVPLNEIKVVFLGNGEVGKSHTIARLLNAGECPSKSFSGSATPGIAIENKEYKIDGQMVQVHFWDFGGQDILYSMHRMFLTKRTLYVILLDARNESKGTQAKEWLDTVKSFAGDAPVLLVVNKTDQNPSASIDEDTLFRKYSNLKKVVYMSALKATREEFNTKFTDSMLELIQKSGFLDIKWPKKWTQVKAGLQNMQEPYIFSDAYNALCQECDVNDNQINLLEWFNDLGVSFCQFRDYNLKDFVILRPDWMTNAIYTILFNKREEVENGMISLEEISNPLNPTPENREQIRQVVSDVKYNWQEINYVLDVVRKFRLSYSVNRDLEFFPMLCKENSKPIAQEYANASDTLEFQMKFEYLPNNVLHRLMVERWSELDKDNVWLTGARFVQPNTGLSAVVRIDGNVLQIYVKSENELHSRNTYLSIIEGSVDQIRQELKLPKPRNRLVYKVDNRRAEFDYERLLKMYAKGKETEYSDELDEDFSIWDILNQFAPAESTEQERLLADLVKACGQLQAEKHYWETKENPRNSYIRNALDNMGYVLRDQTLRGISGGETEEGELDLDIRKYKDVPWTICEALRVDSGSKTDWNFHLKKAVG